MYIVVLFKFNCILRHNITLMSLFDNRKDLWCFHTRARQRQDNDKTKVEPVHFYYAFHTRFVGPGVKGIIEMHRFNICLVVVLSLSCSGVKAPLVVCKLFSPNDWAIMCLDA